MANGNSFFGSRWGNAILWIFGGLAVAALYGATIHFAKWEKANAQPAPMPVIGATRPSDKDTGVLPNAFVACDVFLPNMGHGVDSATMNTSTVKLFKLEGDKQIEVAGHVNTSGGGDSIIFQPMELLDSGTTYLFTANGVKDTSGALFKPYSMSFTTASASVLKSYPAAFTKVPLPTTSDRGNVFTCVTIGPDHRLYAGTFDGRILRYDFQPDGTLSEPYVLRTVLEGNKSAENPTGNRLITGLTFDPKSTADDMIIWVSNGFFGVEHCPDWSSKISRLSGPGLSKYEDYIVGLPRAWRDHLVFRVEFGPHGEMVFNQGSNSSTGAADNKWGLRNEHLMNAACLQMDAEAIAKRLAAGLGPVNVKTEDDRHYDPWAPDAPVKFYATGLRCGFSLLWHSNGHLYSALNGGASGGQAPGTPDSLSEVPRRIDSDRNGPYTGPAVEPLEVVNETQPDLFIDVVKGGYYGHPNITRGEYILNGGNPDGGKDDFQVHDYPVGTKPDRNWHRPVWNTGMSPSCNGLIEYKGNAFGGALRGKILTTRYSGGKDILVLDPTPDGKITESVTGIDGFTQFVDPLDLVEDIPTGNIYVAEYGGQRLTLLKPKQADENGPPMSKRVFIQTAPVAVAAAQ
jgi:glucose/arabinose dehydrogenase